MERPFSIVRTLSSRCVALGALVTLSAGCSFIKAFQRPPKTLFLSVSTGSKDHHSVTHQMLNELRLFVDRSDFVAIDFQQASGTANLLASPGNPQELSAATYSLRKRVENEVEPSLLHAFRRFRQYVVDSQVPVHGVIVTEGTKNAATLATLTELSKEIAAKDAEYSLCIVGLDPQKREITVSALSPLNGHLESAQGQLEWQKCVDNMR